jgi:hypothetical protein
MSSHEPNTRLILVCASCGKEIPHNIYCECCTKTLKQDEYAPLSRRIEKLARRVVELERKMEERKE